MARALQWPGALPAAPVARRLIEDGDLEQSLVHWLLALAEAARDGGQRHRSVHLLEAARALDGPVGHGPCGCRLAPPAPEPSLTRRQTDVARLIASGLTNRQIASVLRIGERTAETHVQNILTRLCLTSRAQIAAWWVRQEVLVAASRPGEQASAAGA